MRCAIQMAKSRTRACARGARFACRVMQKGWKIWEECVHEMCHSDGETTHAGMRPRSTICV